MNLDALNYVLAEKPWLIEQAAEETGVKWESAMGVARVVLANHGSVAGLTPRQRHVAVKVLKPLFGQVPCEGVFGFHEDGTDTCDGDGFIDNKTLPLCYLDHEFVCQHCRWRREEIRLH